MQVYDIGLDMAKAPGRVPSQVRVRSGDAGTQVVSASLTSGGAPYEPECAEARLDIMHADGTWARCAAMVSGATVTCELPGAALASPGLCRMAHFVFKSADGVESTEGFMLRVLPAVEPSDEDVGIYDDKMDKLYKKWLAYEKQAEANEAARVSAESTRKSSEAARQQAETKRASAEETRETNEGTRKSNETARKSAETKRANAEKARADAEAARVEAEEGRAAAEWGRVSAESGRVTAESERQSRFSAQMQSSQSAVNAANGAASNANDAATYAKSVADNLKSSAVGDDGVAAMQAKIDKLGSMVANATGRFFYMDGTVYAPSSKASVSGSTVTLADTCSASGTTITLA